ncbi:MAG: recombinase [Cellulosilyticum sp.]|nr:recombinase [Cellulosilyticum sp.]
MSKGLLLQHLLEEYLLEIQLKNYSIRTLKSVKNNNGLFLRYLESEFKIETLDKLSHVHIKAYIKYKQSLGLKATYINSILRNLSMFFCYLKEEGYIRENFAKMVRWQKQDKVIIKSFTDKEVSKMINAFSYNTYLEARNKCIVAMLCDTGIRNSELCNIKCVDIKKNAILIYGKGYKERFVPISPMLAKIMLKYEQKRKLYTKERYQDEYYFFSQKGKQLTIETVENVVKKSGTLANVRKDIRCSPHTCRHYYAQAQLRNGLDVYSVSRLLGHEDISITKRYLQSIQDEDVLKMAVKTSPLMNIK